VTTIVLLGHILGMVLWVGAALASMMIGIRGRQEERAIQGAVTRLQAMLHKVLIGPGIVLTLLSGFYLSVPAAGAAFPSAWLMVMQVCGTFSGLLMLFVSGPTARRLSRIDPAGPQAPLWDHLRKRQGVAGMIAGTLALLALVSGVLAKY
jgi:Predicted integral membrane protein (DUF2269)